MKKTHRYVLLMYDSTNFGGLSILSVNLNHVKYFDPEGWGDYYKHIASQIPIVLDEYHPNDHRLRFEALRRLNKCQNILSGI